MRCRGQRGERSINFRHGRSRRCSRRRRGFARRFQKSFQRSAARIHTPVGMEKVKAIRLESFDAGDECGRDLAVFRQRHRTGRRYSIQDVLHDPDVVRTVRCV